MELKGGNIVGDVKRLASFVATSGASHRQIARALNISASTVDRACRQLRQMTHSECRHGRPGALTVTQADVRASDGAQSRQGNVIQLRHRSDHDAPSAAVAVADDAQGHAPSVVRPVCPFCSWRAAQPVLVGQLAHCEACGFGFTAEEDR